MRYVVREPLNGANWVRTNGGPWTQISATPVESVSALESGISACPRITTGSPRKSESSGPFSQTPRPRGSGGWRAGSPRKAYFRIVKFVEEAFPFLARAKARPAARTLSILAPSGKSWSMKASPRAVLKSPSTRPLTI